ncbi:hypothetical protein NQ315_011211 [Exocentrus adspersus]|uniref:UDP-glycosyltransferases domain-containing protein n=1 Tax=Exocentrus adspersus TaxID=1586481 RepID=A0AAV8VFD1_9CUCU|nr:hypothetical protein NQ315_011211 [Exocentrus adspersus]
MRFLVSNVSVVTFIICIGLRSAYSANILFVSVTPSLSHQKAFQPVWKELSLRGHNVHAVTTNPLKDPALRNLTEYDLGTLYDALNRNVSADARNYLLQKPSFFMVFLKDSFVTSLFSKLGERAFEHEEMQKLLKTDIKFDVVIVEWLFPTMSAFGAKYKCPLIGISSLGAPIVALDAIGNPSHPISSPDHNLPVTRDMSFRERLMSCLYSVYVRAWYHLVVLPREDRSIKKYLGEDLPYIGDIERNISVLLLNRNPVFHRVLPVVPAVVELGGISLNRTKPPLAKDLQKFLDESKQGAIYFSLGSNLKSIYLPNSTLSLLLEVFGKLPYNVVLKWENDTLPGKPNNVFISKWLPQLTVLDHPNTKLFIMQGGLQSSEEAILAKVPIIGFPTHSDQTVNVDTFVKYGVGIALDLDYLTPEQLKSAIHEIMTNKSYEINARTLAGLMYDQPVDGLKRAVWWIEYVIRHKGARHLRSPILDIPWWQYFMLDVIGFFVGSLMLNTAVSLVTMKMNLQNLGVVLLLVYVAEAANILGIFMVPSYSHQVVYQPIWRELSLRGHKVTVYTPNPLKDPTLTNLTEIDLSFSYDIWNKFGSSNFDKHSKIEETKGVFTAFHAVFEAQMSSPEMQKLLASKNKEKYDLFLVEYLYPSMYPFKDVFDCPMVGISSLPLTATGLEAMGNLKHPVLDPEFLLTFSTDLSFRERVTSVLFHTLIKINYVLSLGPKLNAEARKFFGPETRDVIAVARDASLVLGNFNYITQNVRPNVPAFVELAGIHLKPPQPLPKDLKKFLDDSNEGVVYFSLGTNVKSSLLPQDTLTTIISAFSELPYKVLFKFETDNLKNISNFPANVEIRQWIPQQDVLRHPNLKLFVTQGGLQSIDEALNAKVPMLIMPFFGDQDFNADKMVRSGAALSIDLYDFSKEELVEKINKLIQNPEFKKTVSDLGSRAFDQQVPPLEKAVWWIEYVIRHNGAHHLKYKAVHMPFYQYYLLDVLCFVLGVLAAIVYLLVKIYKLCVTVLKYLGGVRVTKSSLKKSQ